MIFITSEVSNNLMRTSSQIIQGQITFTVITNSNSVIHTINVNSHISTCRTGNNNGTVTITGRIRNNTDIKVIMVIRINSVIFIDNFVFIIGTVFEFNS